MLSWRAMTSTDPGLSRRSLEGEAGSAKARRFEGVEGDVGGVESHDHY